MTSKHKSFSVPPDVQKVTLDQPIYCGLDMKYSILYVFVTVSVVCKSGSDAMLACFCTRDRLWVITNIQLFLP